MKTLDHFFIWSTNGSCLHLLTLVSAVVGDPAKAVSSSLSPRSEGATMRKHPSPYGAVFSNRRSERRDVLFRLSSVRHHAAVHGNRRLQACECTMHAYSLWFLLHSSSTSSTMQDSIAARADVPQHVLHWVRRLCFISFIQPLPLTRTQWCFITTRHLWLSNMCVSDCHQLLKENDGSIQPTRKLISYMRFMDAKWKCVFTFIHILTSSTEARCFARLASCLRWMFLSWRESISSCFLCRVLWSCRHGDE